MLQKYADETNHILNEFQKWNFQIHNYPNPVGLSVVEQASIVWTSLNANKDDDFIEVGSFFGGSAVLMCLVKTFLSSNNNVYSTDINFQDGIDHLSLEGFDRNLKPFAISKKICCGGFELPEYLKNLEEKPKFSLVFIDGWHTFRGAYHDFLAVEPYLTDNAFVMFHDLQEVMTDEAIDLLYEDVKTNYDEYIDDPHYESRCTGGHELQTYNLERAVVMLVKEHGFKIIKCPLFNTHSCLCILHRE